MCSSIIEGKGSVTLVTSTLRERRLAAVQPISGTSTNKAAAGLPKDEREAARLYETRC
jgi:hypothetical protein